MGSQNSPNSSLFIFHFSPFLLQFLSALPMEKHHIVSLPLFCALLLLSCCQTNCEAEEEEQPAYANQIYSEANWNFIMSKRLEFNHSKNFYGMKQLSDGGPFYAEDFDQIGRGDQEKQQNIDIMFEKDPEDGALMCKYWVAMNPLTLGWYEEDGQEEDEDGVQQTKWKLIGNGTDGEYEKKYVELMAEKCLTNNPCIKRWKDGKRPGADADSGVYGVWMDGGGTFNEEMEDPHCLYDFYRIAMERSEYEMFRYCAKAYFYQGFDYNYPRARFMREDWTLYIIEGTIKCNLTGSKSQQDNDMLLMGFRLEMGQTYPDNCNYQILSQFKDDDRDGKFMLAGITGSTNNQDPACNKVWPAKDERNLTLKVGHYCTKAKEYEELNFNLNFKPEELANSERGVQEDQGLQIWLHQGFIHFTTDHILCADGKSGCDNEEIRTANQWKLRPKPEEEKPKGAETLMMDGGPSNERNFKSMHDGNDTIAVNGTLLSLNATMLIGNANATDLLLAADDSNSTLELITANVDLQPI